MNALAEEELLRPNVDVPAVVPRVLGALPALRSLRSEMARRLPEHDLSLLDRLGTFTLALAHAHALTLTSRRTAEDMAPIRSEATALRKSLLADARLLDHHGLLEVRRSEDVKNLPGDRNVAFDLLALAMLLRKSWPAVAGKTPLSLEDLARAEDLARQLLDHSAARSRKKPLGEATVLRQRAFTLFYRAHRETRRAVTYLRWNEGDADRYCPPLFVITRGRRGAVEGDP